MQARFAAAATTDEARGEARVNERRRTRRGGEEEAGTEAKLAEGGEDVPLRTEGKRGWREGVGEPEECHNSLQIGEADGTVPDLVVYSLFRGLRARERCVK